MKKLITAIFFFICLASFGQEDEYYRLVDWKFYPDSVYQLTDSTYIFKADPIDYTDPGAINRTIGNYVVDYVGHRFLVIDSSSTTITVEDVYRTGQAPQSLQIARCYKSVGNGKADFVGSVDYSPLDESSKWKLNGADNELLWREIQSGSYANHPDLTNLGWTTSGHSDGSSKIAAFDAVGAATTLDTITNLASQYDLTLKQSQLNGTGFVKASGTTISYDNSSYLNKTITTNPDYNTLTTPVWGRNNSTSIANAPTAGLHWYISGGNNDAMSSLGGQLALGYSTTGGGYQQAKLYMRSKSSSSTWNDWIEAYTTNNANLTSVNWSSNINNSLQYNLNGTNINTAGTLTNVAYKGALTTNYLVKYDGTRLGNSQISDNGTNVGIGTVSPLFKLDVRGNTNTYQGTSAITSIIANSTNASGYHALKLTTANNSRNTRLLYGESAGNVVYSVRGDGTTLIGTDTDNTVDKLQVSGSILGTTAKLTNLTDNFIPIHKSDALGFENSRLFFSGNIVRYSDANTFSNARDIVDKAYVDAIASGNMPKLPVDAATTTNITLSGTQTIDGYAVSAGQRVLVKNQSTASQNGVYVVAAGAWSRATDLDTWTELYKAYVAVLNGGQSGASYVCNIASTGTLGTDAITWVLYSAPTNIIAGDGILKTGNIISADYGGTGTATTLSRSDHTQAASTITSPGNLTAGSSKITIGGTGTGATLQNVSVDVDEANLTLSSLGGSVTDSQVPNDITLTNITQITNRSHTNLSDIGTNTHAQIDTHITNDGDLSATNEIQKVDTFSIVGNQLQLSLQNDGEAKKTIDLSAYVNPDLSGYQQNSDTLGFDATKYDLSFKQDKLNGNGFVKANGTAISYDNTEYLALSGGTMSNNNLVNNLNADLLDGYNYTSFIPYSVYSYTSGILIATDISSTSDAMFTFVVDGNGYNGEKFQINAQGYNYNSANLITRYKGNSINYNSPIYYFNYNGFVYIWLSEFSSFQTFNASVISGNSSPRGVNRITSITNSAKPTTGVTREVSFTCKKVWTESNSNINTVNWLVANATTQYHAVNKGQLDAAISGISIGNYKLKSDSTASDGYVRRDRLTSSLATKENAFSKNTAFNKNFGTTAGTVLEGRTFGTAANNNTGDFDASGTAIGLMTTHQTTYNHTNYNTAYNDKINSLAVTGTTTKTITLTQQDGGIVSNTFADLDNQNLSKSKTGNNITVNISGGSGTTFSVADADSSKTNEIQDLSLIGNTLSLSQSVATIDLTPYTDANWTDEGTYLVPTSLENIKIENGMPTLKFLDTGYPSRFFNINMNTDKLFLTYFDGTVSYSHDFDRYGLNTGQLKLYNSGYQDIDGSIRYDGSDLLGRTGGTWKSLTSSGWTNSSGALYPTTITDEVRIGSATDLGSEKLQVSGNAKVTGSLTSLTSTVDGNINLGNFIRFSEIGAPSTPPSSYGYLYEKTDSKLYFKNDLGVEYDLTSSGSSYTLPLAANGTRGGLQIGYTSTANNFALQLSSEKAFTALPDATPSVKGIASFNTSNFSTSSGAVSIKTGGVSSANIADKGANTQVLFNNSGTISGDADLTFDGTNITVGGYVSSDENRVQSSVVTTMNMQSGMKGISTTLTANRNIELINLFDGQEGQIEVFQNATGGWNLTLSGYMLTAKKMGSKSTINPAASSHTTVVFWRTGSVLYYGFIYDN
jgi:hypothetical protein